jgi:hypothetical protein
MTYWSYFSLLSIWYPPPHTHTEELTYTFFNDEGAVLGLGGTLAQTHHVLRVDSEVVLVPHHQLGDGDAGAVVVLNTRVPLLSHRKQISLNMQGITLISTNTWIPYAEYTQR